LQGSNSIYIEIKSPREIENVTNFSTLMDEKYGKNI